VTDHLNLGMRYAYISSEELFAGCENFDVFSINCYKMNPAPEIMKAGQSTGLPVMIGEYHFGALDRGPVATGLRAVISRRFCRFILCILYDTCLFDLLFSAVYSYLSMPHQIPRPQFGTNRTIQSYLIKENNTKECKVS
jgi:hypothetical protein